MSIKRGRAAGSSCPDPGGALSAGRRYPVTNRHAKLLELRGYRGDSGAWHAPGAAPASDLGQTSGSGILQDPVLEGRFSDFLSQVNVGQDIHREYIEDLPRIAGSILVRDAQSHPLRPVDQRYPGVVGIVKREVVGPAISTRICPTILRNDTLLCEQLEQSEVGDEFFGQSPW